MKTPVARFKASCFRPNLFYDVVFQESSPDAETDLALYAAEWLGGDWESQPMVTFDTIVMDGNSKLFRTADVLRLTFECIQSMTDNDVLETTITNASWLI